MNSAAVTSPAELLTRIPVTTFMKAGDLRLANHRLTFITVTGEVVLDAPISELHSVAPAATGIHVWHGHRCLRFAFRRESRQFAAMWLSVLTPIVGSPPPGLRVPAPWPKWAWLLAVVGFTVVLIVAIAVLTSVMNS
jgi:hypothetical protein